MKQQTPAHFRKILALPCLKVLTLSIAAQLFLLGLFIFLVNFDIVHPVNWVLQLFGFHWLKHVPLLGIVLANGISLSKTFVVFHKYYPNRFKWLLDNGLRKLVLLTLQIFLGLFSSWSFMSYLHTAYSSVIIEINGIACLNSRYTFLTFSGIFAGFYYFVLSFASQDVNLEFEDIPKPIFIKLRENFLKSVCTSTKNTFMPTIGSTWLYWLCGGFINRRLSFLFNVAVDGQLNSLFDIFTSFSLLFYAWLLMIEIFTLMDLMQHSFSIFIVSECEFPISSDNFSTNITLVAALAMRDVPIVQKLAALDFYNLAKMKSKERRSEIFALSQPGGHPYNWNQLSGQCLSLIDEYIAELSASLKSTPALLQHTPTLAPLNEIQPSATDLAQRILIHQYNEKHSIRRLKSDLHILDQNTQQPTSTVARINANFEQTIQNIKQLIIDIFKSVPGLHYMFGETENAKMAYLLSNADLLIWIIQGLAYICAASLTDDPYGIVQLTLPDIVRTFLRLKVELDKVSNLNLSAKKNHPNFIPLRNALRRSLHKISNAFADYLPQIIEDSHDLPYLRTFLYQAHKF